MKLDIMLWKGDTFYFNSFFYQNILNPGVKNLWTKEGRSKRTEIITDAQLDFVKFFNHF